MNERDRASDGGEHERDVSVAARRSLLGDSRSDAEPRTVARAQGAYVWDVEGRQYQDFLLAFGAVVLGHAHPIVTEAVIEQIRRGVSPSLRSARQHELVQLLCEVVPGAESVLLMKSGSDATTAAIRIARAHTGRSRVLRWGYQGWHDWCAPRGTGIPPGDRELTSVLPYNDIEALGTVFARRGNEVAALIVMPADACALDREYLLECRRLADRYGTVFVLDEVRTGFRLALGGAQEYFEVEADLVTLSKAMANGHPISAVTGRQDIMRSATEVSISSTFFRSCDGMAAAIATIELLAESPALETIWARGRELMTGMRRAAEQTAAPVRVTGLAPMPFHQFELAGEELDLAERVFYDTALRRGLLLHRTHHWFVCAATTAEDIRRAVDGIAEGYGAVVAALQGLSPPPARAGRKPVTR